MRRRLSKAELEHLYLHEKLTSDEIGAMFGWNGGTILQWLRAHGIPRRECELERVNIPRDELEHLYLHQRLSWAEIGKLCGCHGTTIGNKLTEYGIPRRSPAAARMTYPKRDFDGTLADKAYLIGLRLGDLNVYKVSDDSETIVVRCHSTVQDQMTLFRELFEPYGHIWQGKPDRRGAVNATCYLNLSFDFLLPKEDRVELWIQQDTPCAAAFVAGYIDAEGTFGIYEGRARFKLDSQDRGILAWIHTWFQENAIACPPMNCIARAGEVTDRLRQSRLRRDVWRITVNRADSLLKMIRWIQPFVKHRKRRENMQRALENVTRRSQRVE